MKTASYPHFYPISYLVLDLNFRYIELFEFRKMPLTKSELYTALIVLEAVKSKAFIIPKLFVILH